MSHDFPDGPDFNPEPIDDDPWDVPYTSTDDDLSADDPSTPPSTRPEAEKGTQ